MSISELAAGLVAGVTAVGAVPLALRLTQGDANTRAWGRIWPVVGLVAVASLLLGRSDFGVGAALFYLAATAAFGLAMPLRLARVRPLPRGEAAIAGALLSPLAGALLLVADRLNGSQQAHGGLWWMSIATLGVIAGMVGATLVEQSRGATVSVVAGAVSGFGFGLAALFWLAGLAVLAWVMIVAAAIAMAVLFLGRSSAAQPDDADEPCSAQANPNPLEVPASEL